MSKIFIATPAFNNQVTVPYALSLAETSFALKANGHEIAPMIVPSGSLLVSERNRLLQAFWDSGFDYILCIDADLGWPAQAVLAMLAQGKEFICGVYPARSNTENSFIFKPVHNEDGSIYRENHLLKMQCVPAGFMLIHRSAIEKMRNKFPELYYSPKDERDDSESAYALFNTELIDGEFWGEDYVFCRRATEAGVDIWCDPMIEFDHAGKRGMLMSILSAKERPELAE